MKKGYIKALIVVGIIGLGIWGLWTIVPDNRTKDGNVQIELTSPTTVRAGQNKFIVSVKDAAGKPVDDAIVNVDINMTTMNMGKQQGQATAQGDGEYAAVGNLGMLGPWKISTDVALPDGQQASEDFIVNAQ